MLLCEIINSPSRGTVAILKRKALDKAIRSLPDAARVEAVGLIQGQLAQIVVASDIASKAADVLVSEISGSCPQHITMIALFGSVSAVKVAINAVKDKISCKNAVKS
jgi:ethanolamine utilization microcompartment shell protein EutL